MELVVEELPGGVTRAALVGRMDIDGAQAIETRLGALGARRHLVIDLSEVSFMASMGLRALMLCARTVTTHGGRVALASPQANVEKVLTESGIGPIIGVHASLDGAVAAVTA
jgi:anti-anti-sigma factor